MTIQRRITVTVPTWLRRYLGLTMVRIGEADTGVIEVDIGAAATFEVVSTEVPVAGSPTIDN